MIPCCLYYFAQKTALFLLTFFLSFHLFIHSPLGLDHHSLDLPLRMARFLLRDVIARVTHFFRLFVVVINPFSQRKDSYSSLPVDGPLSIPVKYLKESVSWLMRIISRVKNSWRPFVGLELGFPLEMILRSKCSISELAGPSL